MPCIRRGSPGAHIVAWCIALQVACQAAGCSRPPSPAAPPQSSPSIRSNDTQAPTQPAAVRPSGILPLFTEVSSAAGVLFHRDDDLRGQHRILEANGGGVALFDYDGDGWTDVLFTSGCRLPLESADSRATVGLFRKVGGKRYAEVTLPANLKGHGYYYGCAVGDLDNDGFEDLYVTAFGRNALWRNNGDGTFSDITDQTGTQGDSWGSSAAFADFNSDGVLDLYVVTYVEYSAEDARLCPEPGSPDGYTQCSPTIFHGTPDLLFIGNGRGGFREGAAEAGITGSDGKGLGVAVFDADADGRPDIFVANDGVPNFLYMNQTAAAAAQTGDAPGVPRFREEAIERGVSLNALGKAEACMGVACGDYDADGLSDLHVTNFYAETNTLYCNSEGGSFLDRTAAGGIGAPSRPMVGWGTEFCDFDNDGWLDLYVVNGHVDDFSWRTTGPEPYRMRPLLFRNERNSRFVGVTDWAGPYFGREWLGRGAASGDLDNDGDLDLAVSHQIDPSAVLRNDTPIRNRSLLLKLVGTDRSNRSAVNARVEVLGLDLTLVREVIGGGSFQSSSDRRVHVGLGPRAAAPLLRVHWPSGDVEEWPDVQPGHYILIESGGLLALPHP